MANLAVAYEALDLVFYQVLFVYELVIVVSG